MTTDRAFQLSLTGHRAPVDYDRPPTYSGMITEKDVLVPMRDGVKIAADVYRPDTTERLPALLAFSIHNKDLQGPELAEATLTHPAWSMLWTGPAEAGDTRFFVSRGYVHVIGNPRGIGKSEGGGSRAFDSYDLIEWIAAQPWCDGNVGMVGISGFGAEQFMAAKLQPPHLKAIFPFDPRGAYGEAGGFREEYPGGVIHPAREGERDVTPGLHERELTRGWLKASHRAVEPARSLPGRPWHPLTRAARKPVVPGEINEYAVEIMATANQFKRGHRICVEITSLDVGTGVGSATNVEYIPYHICSSKTVLHKIYHNSEHPSHLLLPVIPDA